jgi:hypothetical protein
MILGVSLIVVSSPKTASALNSADNTQCQDLHNAKTASEKQLAYACLDAFVKELQVDSGALKISDVAEKTRAIRDFMDQANLGVKFADQNLSTPSKFQADEGETAAEPAQAMGQLAAEAEEDYASAPPEEKDALARKIAMYKDAQTTFELLKARQFDKLTEHSTEVIRAIFGDNLGQKMESLVKMAKSGSMLDPNTKNLDGVDDDGRAIISSIHWLNEGGYSGWMSLQFADVSAENGEITITKTVPKVDGEKCLNQARDVRASELKALGLQPHQIFRAGVNVRAGKDSQWSHWYRFDESSRLSVGYMTNGTVFKSPQPAEVPVGSYDDVVRTFHNTQTNILKLIGTIILATAVSVAASAITSLVLGPLAPASPVSLAVWEVVAGLTSGVAAAVLTFSTTMTLNDEAITDVNLANQKRDEYDWKTVSRKKSDYAPYKYADYGWGKDFYGNFQISRFSYVNKGYYSAKPIINWKHCADIDDAFTCRVHKSPAREDSGAQMGYRRLGKGFADVEIGNALEEDSGAKPVDGDEVWITASAATGYERWSDGGPDDCRRSKAAGQTKCVQREHFIFSHRAGDMVGYITQGATFSGDQKMHLVAFGTPEVVEPIMQQYLKDAQKEFAWVFIDIGVSVICSWVSKYIRIPIKMTAKNALREAESAAKIAANSIAGSGLKQAVDDSVNFFTKSVRFARLNKAFEWSFRLTLGRIKSAIKAVVNYAQRFTKIFYASTGMYPNLKLYDDFLMALTELSTNNQGTIDKITAFLKNHDYDKVLNLIDPQWIDELEANLARALATRFPHYLGQDGEKSARAHLTSASAIFRYLNAKAGVSADYMLSLFGNHLNETEQKAVRVFAEFARTCGDNTTPEMHADLEAIAQSIRTDLQSSGAVSKASFVRVFQAFSAYEDVHAPEKAFFSTAEEFADAFMSAVEKIAGQQKSLSALDVVRLLFVCDVSGKYREILIALFGSAFDEQYFKYMDIMVEMLNAFLEVVANSEAIAWISNALSSQNAQVIQLPENLRPMLASLVKSEADVDAMPVFSKPVLYNVVYITSLVADGRGANNLRMRTPEQTPGEQNLKAAEFGAVANLALIMLNQIAIFGDDGFGYAYDFETASTAWDSIYTQGEDAITRSCDVVKYWKSTALKPFSKLPNTLYSADFDRKCNNYGASHPKWLNFQVWSNEYINYKSGNQKYVEKCEPEMTNYYSNANYDSNAVFECKKYAIHYEDWFKNSSWSKNAVILSAWWENNRSLIGKYTSYSQI